MCIRLLPIFEYDFLSDCQSLMYGIGIHDVQQFQTMLEREVIYICELAHFFFSFKINFIIFTTIIYENASHF